MYSGKYVFSQVIALVNKYEFNKRAKRYDGNYHIRELDSWNHFVQLFFGQLSSLNSLRSICLCLQAHKQKLYHLGIRQSVHFSSLSRANEQRNWQIFADFGDYLIHQIRPLYADCPVPGIDLNNEIFAFDSTTISVSLNLFTWAKGKYTRGAVKMHTLLNLHGCIPEFILITEGKYHDSNALDVVPFYANAIYLLDKAYLDLEALYRINNAGAFFVTRAKKTLQYRVLEEKLNIEQKNGIRGDKIVELLVWRSKHLYPGHLRIVEFYDEQSSEWLVFLTNHFEVSASEVPRLYKNRWQIEVFFKWIKQNLTVKNFWGHSQNAVKIHLWVAICTQLIIAYVKHVTKSPLSIYEIHQILKVSIFDKTPLCELLADALKKKDNQDRKELLLF